MGSENDMEIKSEEKYPKSPIDITFGPMFFGMQNVPF